MYDHPKDFAHELAIQQILAKEYGVKNREDRIELWDHIIKFTYYEQYFAYEIQDSKGDSEARKQDSYAEQAWRKSGASFHNRVLKQLRRSERAEIDGGDYWLHVVKSETTPMKRYNTELEPMDDVEEFVLTY
ncbi:hypothetical protein [Halomonas sp.]|uniref:hypothetical protein n=1 Tax=Halomonas sp. TaxID=1486246 RepID=UPI0035619B9D